MVGLRAAPGQLSDDLREAAHEVGFCYLTGHGVPAALAGRLLEVTTGGYLCATEHRVNLHESLAERIPVAYFFNPPDAPGPVPGRADCALARMSLRRTDTRPVGSNARIPFSA